MAGHFLCVLFLIYQVQSVSTQSVSTQCPAFSFTEQTYTASESDESLLVTVQRTGQLSDAVTIGISSDGPFSLNTGTITFPANENQVQIPITWEDISTAISGIVQLSNPTPGMLGPFPLATINIQPGEGVATPCQEFQEFQRSSNNCKHCGNYRGVPVNIDSCISPLMTYTYRSNPAQLDNYLEADITATHRTDNTMCKFCIKVIAFRTGCRFNPQFRQTKSIAHECVSQSTCSISTNTYYVPEGDSLQIPVQKYGSNAGTVYFATEQGTATPVDDFVAVGKYLCFTENSTMNVKLITEEDTEIEGDESLYMYLSMPFIGIILEPNRVKIVIVDDDSELLFLKSSYDFLENTGSSIVTIQRRGFLKCDATVQIIASGDISLTESQINFPANQETLLLTIAVANDDIAGLNRVGTLTLSNPSTGVIGDIGSTTVTIIDDDENQPVVAIYTAVLVDVTILAVNYVASVFTSDLLITTSPYFLEYASRITTIFRSFFLVNLQGFRGVRVVSFRPGSVVAQIEVTLTANSPNAGDNVVQAMRLINSDDITVDTSSIEIVAELCLLGYCQNNGVCEPDVAKLESVCICAEEYSGTRCENPNEDNVNIVAIVVPAVILLLAIVIAITFVCIIMRMRQMRQAQVMLSRRRVPRYPSQGRYQGGRPVVFSTRQSQVFYAR